MERALVFAAILLAVLIGFWGPLRGVRTVLGVGHLISTGHAFLVLGWILGWGLGPRTEGLVADLGPVVAFVGGCVGFATGMRFELRLLRTIPKRAFFVALVPGVFAAAVVGLTGLLVLDAAGVPPAERLAASLVLAAAAACSGPTLAALVRRRRAGRAFHTRPVLRMIELSAGIDDLLVVVLALVAFPLFRGEVEAVYTLVAAALLGGALLGIVTWLFLGGRASEDERLLLGLAMLAFIAGFAEWLGVSPAAVGAVAAMVLVNLPGERMAQLQTAVQRIERPAVVILMTVIGFHATGAEIWLFIPLFVTLTVIRVAAKGWAGTLVRGSVAGAPGLRAAGPWGLGLAPVGTLGVVVALSFFHLWRDEVARTVLIALAAASLISEIAAPWLMVRVVQDLGRSALGRRSAA